MSKESLLAQITSNPNLPTPPSVALQVVEKASRPHCTISEIGQIISRDPSLCGRILKMVNSALFGMPRSVSSIDRALNLLGLKRVRSLVMSLSLPSMQVRSKLNPRMRDFWKSSVAAAIVCRELAVRVKYADPDSEMVSGLLADLGTLILQEVYPDPYTQVLAYPPEVLVNSQCEVEEKILGINHAEVGAYILKRWRLPQEMTDAVLYHHKPAEAPSSCADRAYLLYFANRIAQLQLTIGASEMLGEIVSLAKNRYDMNDQEFQEFLSPLTAKVEEFAGLLQVDIGTCQQFPTLFAHATENLTRLAVETSLDNFRFQEEKTQAEVRLKKAEEALQESEEKLRQAQKMEAIGRLAGGVAHDFNNLLTVINGYSEVLLQILAPSDPNRAAVEEIKKAGARAHELTRQLLAFSRKQILVPQVVNLNTVVAGTEKMLRRLIGADIELVSVLEPSLHLVKVDPNQMDQVLMNLAINARDAMPKGGKLTIETSNVNLEQGKPYDDLKPGHYVRLTMSDTGCGMSAEVQKRLFEPFFTTKEHGVGTGLGLATVHGIIKQSGGHINVYSEVGHGTAFKVYLPVTTESAAAPQPDVVVGRSPRGSETILLTEDEEGVRKLARSILHDLGYTVLEAADGWQALQVSQNHSGPIDLLVTDTIMPNMGGCELAKRMSALHPRLKVLYTSGYTDEAVIRHGVLNVGLPFLQKPFTPQTLGLKVYQVLHPGSDMPAVAVVPSSPVALS